MFNLPKKIKIIEVGPRDGLQSLNKWVPTKDKINMINLLSDAQFPVIEVSSFAHPDKVPMLKDVEKVLENINRRQGTIYRVLVPNLKGALRAVETKMVDEILGLLTISETYLLKNQNMSIDDAIESASIILKLCEKSGVDFLMALGVAFVCPYEGVLPNEKIFSVVNKLHNKGIRRIYLAASTGMENPLIINHVFKSIKNRWPNIEIGFHVHERFGMATVNMLAALDAGVTFIEGSICGIGGGIVMPKSMGDIGNLPTEDIVNLLNTLNVKTQLNTELVLQTARKISSILNIQCRGYISRY